MTMSPGFRSHPMMICCSCLTDADTRALTPTDQSASILILIRALLISDSHLDLAALPDPLYLTPPPATSWSNLNLALNEAWLRFFSFHKSEGLSASTRYYSHSLSRLFDKPRSDCPGSCHSVLQMSSVKQSSDLGSAHRNHNHPASHLQEATNLAKYQNCGL